MIFRMPTKVIIGENLIEQMIEKLTVLPLGKFKHFVGYTVVLIDKALESVVSSRIKEMNWDIRIISGEPTVKEVDQMISGAYELAPIRIIAIGGGSTIDFAKALSVGWVNKGSIWEYTNLSYREAKPIKYNPVPVIAVPTTSGSGSEVTSGAVLINEELKQKGTIEDDRIFPKIAYLDPALCATMPPELTAITTMDATAHAMEASFSGHKVAMWAGLEALKVMGKCLINVMVDTANLEARAEMCWASMLSGVAIAHGGTTVPHAIAEVIGARYGIPHGEAVSASIVPVLTVTDGCEEASKHLAKLLVNIGLGKPLSEEYPDISVDEVVDTILQYKFRPLERHPVKFTKAQLKDIVKEVVYGWH